MTSPGPASLAALSIVANALGIAVGLTGLWLSPFDIHGNISMSMWVAMTTAAATALLVISALSELAAHCVQDQAYDTALRYARRALQLDPLREPAHRHAMRCLALTEGRAAALAPSRFANFWSPAPPTAGTP